MNPRERLSVAGAVALVAALSMPIAASASSVKPLTRQQALEMRLDLPEKQNQTLEIQNHTIQSQLSDQKAEIDALKQQMQSTVQPVANLQREMPQLKQQFAAIEEKQGDLPFEVGFRTGWAESPYEMPGGFFYSAYLNHRLLTPEDGIPGGFVSGELSAGVILGNHASTAGNLYSELGHPAASTWLDTIEIQPTVQYHLEPGVLGYRSLAAVKPYVLAGPAMWINLLSTPVVVTGKQPAASYRHYDADFQGGGVFGFGTEVSLSTAEAPAIQRILDKSSLGAEWRYNQFANGQAFQQYSGSIGFGW